MQLGSVASVDFGGRFAERKAKRYCFWYDYEVDVVIFRFEAGFMPIYEYICDDCGERYERLVMNGKTSVACPKCASGKHTLQLSVFAAPANGSKSSAGPSSSGGCCGGACGCN